MGVLIGLVSYLAAVATTVGAAVMGFVWLTNPAPSPRSTSALPVAHKTAPVRATVGSAKLLKSNVSLTSQRRPKELTAQRSVNRSAKSAAQ
jgi:hypothetical protein